MIKVKKYFQITKGQIDELLSSGVLLIKDEKIFDTYYKISKGVELISRKEEEIGGSRKINRYFKLKVENNFGEEIKTKDEKEIKVRLGISQNSIEDFLSEQGITPFAERKIIRKEFPKETMMVRIDSENGDRTCRLQLEVEKGKTNDALLKIKSFAKQYGLKKLEILPRENNLDLEIKKIPEKNIFSTAGEIKMK